MSIALSIFLYISGALTILVLLSDEPDVDPMPILALKLVGWPIAIWVALAAAGVAAMRGKI